MGQWIAKEWRAVEGSDEDDKDDRKDNETPKSDRTSMQHDRLRVLKEDPRSPSGSISRTPIEVMATPDVKAAEFSPAPSPAFGSSPGVGLLKKEDLHRKLFRRNPPPKMQVYENRGEDTEN